MKYKLSNLSDDQLLELGEQLKTGAIAVISTDTQYGIVTTAQNKNSVEQIYKLRQRSSNKPLIILIDSIEDISNLGVAVSNEQKEILAKLWPNPVSVILPVPNPELEYLHRGKMSLAFRLPQTEWLRKLLRYSGPLVAPSANLEGEKPSATINEAEKYFGDQIDFYLDDGDKTGRSSTVIKLLSDDFEVIREGDFKVTSL